MSDPQRIFTLATLLGALGMWLMLPRGAGRGRVAGAMVMAIALGLWASQTAWLGNWVEQSVFFVLAGTTVIAAIATVTFQNPVYCAVWFGMSLLGSAGLLFFTGAQFLATATIVVYAGAILVTFLFVLMLAQPEGRAAYDRTSWEALISAATGMVIVGILTMTVTRMLRVPGTSDRALAAAAPAEELAAGVLSSQHVVRIGMELFGRYLIAIEVAGLLLFAALVGAAVIVAQSRSGPPSETPDTITYTEDGR